MPAALAKHAELGPLGQKILDELEPITVTRKELTEQTYRDALASYATARDFVVGIAALSVLAGILLAWIGAGAISKPLKKAVGVLERVAEGDLTQGLDIDRADEVGMMASALNKSIESVRTTLASVQSVSMEVSAAASELAANAQSIATGAQEQAASLEETAASVEEISSTVKQNTANAQAASDIATAAQDAAERGADVVRSAVGAMSEITKSSKKIADIITTIDEIAFQTNLLALNAAGEAARAGEQGRGFAVVAAEVRSLAQRTGSAAKEIRGLIADSSSKVEAGTFQVNESGKTLDEIVRSVKRVTEMVAEIASASREQNTGLDQVNAAVSQVDQVTQTNAAHTEELSATAAALADKSTHLQSLVAAFELGAGHAGRPASAAAGRPRPKPPVRLGAPVSATRMKTVSSSAPLPKASGGFEEF